MYIEPKLAYLYRYKTLLFIKYQYHSNISRHRYPLLDLPHGIVFEFSIWFNFAIDLAFLMFWFGYRMSYVYETLFWCTTYQPFELINRHQRHYFSNVKYITPLFIYIFVSFLVNVKINLQVATEGCCVVYMTKCIWIFLNASSYFYHCIRGHSIY